jgi:L-alanine-DL-glutamate epimerase-like enolase superfamily enzyme
MTQSLTATCLQIPFKQSFKHASAERRTTQTVWVKALRQSGAIGFGEGCPREYVTGESVASALEFIRLVEPEVRDIATITELRSWVDQHSSMIDTHPAAWCAVETSLLDAMAREAGQTVETLLGLPTITGPFHYSAVLGAETPDVFETQLRRYLQMGFHHFKVKLSGDSSDLQRLALLQSVSNPIQSLRFDANNLWGDPSEAIKHLREISSQAFAIEEPVAARDLDSARTVSQATGLKIILDESLLRIEHLDDLDRDPSTWIINVRVSKMGGLLRSIKLMEQATISGIPFIIGCQVGETSLLTRVALSLAQAFAGSALIAQEGAFGTLLLAHDIIDLPLMFGQGGLLDVTGRGFASDMGFGIDPRGDEAL